MSVQFMPEPQDETPVPPACRWSPTQGQAETATVPPSRTLRDNVLLVSGVGLLALAVVMVLSAYLG
ncbi:hypothetical protein [Roseibium aestuarii]|uniref:Ssl1498 family light-harvesting-like protein n=1 Tax=Roseibium aestuarii TaxID=2600299 RepID=A0ABW4JU77_9HYPH|nr:hypothetical protein [Roseibium aestuarii]